MAQPQRLPTSSHTLTVDMIEQDILDAEAALNRLGEDAHADARFSGSVPTSRPDVSGESASRDADGRRPTSISETRRKQILAQLASERAERRGFASDRETRVVESVISHDQSSRAPATAQLQSIDVPTRQPARGAEAVNRAVQDAAAAAVASALDRAMASLGRGGSGTASSSATESHSSVRHEQVFTTALQQQQQQQQRQQWVGAGAREGVDQAEAQAQAQTYQGDGYSRGGNASQPTAGLQKPGSSPEHPPAAHMHDHGAAGGRRQARYIEGGQDGASAGSRPYTLQSKEEKEVLIAQLLAERRAKIGYGDGSPSSPASPGDHHSASSSLQTVPGRVPGAAGARASYPHATTMPAVPPIVAQLQAQARVAAETAARAAEAAAVAAVQQGLIERGIADQQRQLEEVRQGHQEAPPTSTAQPVQVISSSPDRRSARVKITSSPVPPSTPAQVPQGSPPRAQPMPPVEAQAQAQDMYAGLDTRSLAATRAGSKGGVTGSAAGSKRSGAASVARGHSNSNSNGQGSAERKFQRPTKQQVAAEREAALYGQCTFQPGSAGSGTGTGSGSGPGTGAGGARAPPSSPPRIRTERVTELARTKSEQWEALQRKKKQDDEERMRVECTFQPNASVDVGSGMVVGRDGKVMGLWPGKVMDKGAEQRKARSKSPALYHQPAWQTAAPASAPALPPQPPAAVQHRPMRVEPPRVRAPSPPPVTVQAPQQPQRAQQASQGATGFAAGTATYQRPFAPARGASSADLELQSPLQWEKSRAKQYVDGLGIAQAGSFRTSAQQQQAQPAPPPVSPAPPVQPSMYAPTGATCVSGASRGATVVQHRQPPAPSPRPVPVPAPAPAPAPAAPATSSVPAVAQRLFAEADARALKRARAKAVVEQRSIAQYSFRPSLNPASLALVHKAESEMSAGQPTAPVDKQRGKPLHERSAALARAHEQHLHRLRVEAAMANPDTTFKPKINAVSERIAAAKAAQQGLPMGSDAAGSSVPVSVAATERMVAGGVVMEARRRAARETAARAEAQAHPFAPKILPSSQRMLEHKLRSMGLDEDAAAALAGSSDSSGGGGGGPADAFLTRQHLLSQLSKKRQEHMVAELKAADPCTFRPDIGNAEEILALTRPDMVTESEEDRVHRLATQDAQDMQKARNKAEEEYYGRFSHQPVLNSNSLARARGKTVEERSRNEAGARSRLRAQALAEAQFQAEHPFQPTLVASEPHRQGRRGSHDSEGSGEDANAGSIAGASGGALRLAIFSDPDHVSERIQAHEQAKAAKIEVARKLAEYESMQGCTFAPDIVASRKSHARAVEQVNADGGAVVVRGLGRHLELRELTRKLEDEKREREAEAFTVKGPPHYMYADLLPGQPRPPTVPQPFHLSTAETAPLIAARHAEREQRHAVAAAAASGVSGSGAHGASGVQGGLKASTRAMLVDLLDRDTTALLAGIQQGQGVGEGAHGHGQWEYGNQVHHHDGHAPASGLLGGGNGSVNVTQGINITRM